MTAVYDATRKRWRVQFGLMVEQDDGSRKRIRTNKVLPAGTTREAAEAINDKLYAEAFTRNALVRPVSGWREQVAAWRASNRSWIYSTLASCRNRAKRKGIACSLTADDIANLLERCRGRCEVSGIPLNWSNPTGARYKPYSQSLDRIDSAGGYSLSNCRIVCYAVNLAMLSWGESVFSNIAVGYVMNKYVASSLVGALIEGHQAGRPNPPTA